MLWTDGLEDLARQLEIHPLCLAHKLELAKASGERLSLLDEAKDDILLASVRLPKLTGAPMEEDFYPLLLAEYHGGQAAEIDDLSDWWLRHLRVAFPQMSDSSEHDVLLAAREAVLNAMEHGCRGEAGLHVRFQISCQPERQLVRIWVEDPGSGHQFDFTAHATNAAEKIIDEHRGLIFITNLAQTVKFERCGATVIMEFKID